MVGREYQRAILRDESQNIVCPKGAQMGFTIIFVMKALHALTKRGWSVLYLLPLKAGSVQFVQGRIDPIIDSNKALSVYFKRVDNRNQKATIDGARFYIRGTNIQSELREVPADVLVLDERDVANEDYLSDAYARLDGSDVQRIFELSTPTVDGHGVYGSGGWKSSDQHEWWVKCPSCSSRQILTWEENVLPFIGDTAEESKDACRCTQCGRSFSDDDRASMNSDGVWVPTNPGAYLRGYRISQLNSPTKTLAHPTNGILTRYFDGQTDAGVLKAFYTLCLGQPYAAPGDKFTVELLDSCRQNYGEGVMAPGQLCIGIDQGMDVLHVTVWSHEGRRFRLLRTHLITQDANRKKWRVLDEEVLQPLAGRWTAVCDAHPDKEDAEELGKRYPGQFFMGFEKDRLDQEVTAKWSDKKYGEAATVMIDRTMAFDGYIKLAMDGNMLLPREARDMGEHMPKLPYNGFYHQHLQMVRLMQADSSERLVARWVNGVVVKRKPGASKTGKRPDHWMHSGMFGMVAGMQAAPLIVSRDVGELFTRAGGLVVSR